MAERRIRGSRVVVTGRLKQLSYETWEGEKCTVLEVEADDVTVSLKFASAKVTKAARSGAGQSASGQGSSGRGQPAGADPWATEGPGSYSDEAPF